MDARTRYQQAEEAADLRNAAAVADFIRRTENDPECSRSALETLLFADLDGDLPKPPQQLAAVLIDLICRDEIEQARGIAAQLRGTAIANEARVMVDTVDARDVLDEWNAARGVAA